MFKEVKWIKILLVVDFQDDKKYRFILVLTKHCLGEIWKRSANTIGAKHGLSLQKLSKKHKVEEKNWSLKRTPGECKDKFNHLRNENASKNKFNSVCNEESVPERKVTIDEVDTSNKVRLNWKMLQVWSLCKLILLCFAMQLLTLHLHKFYWFTRFKQC